MRIPSVCLNISWRINFYFKLEAIAILKIGYKVLEKE